VARQSVKFLSIICITYNHEKFIRDALEGFVMQKTKFYFEAVVSDDCSTDKTADIICEYEQKYPDIIKAIYNPQNIGAYKNFVNALSGVQSKYVIFNEGDDYFTDPYKLQKQVDFLELRTDCSICFHPVEVKFENSKKYLIRKSEIFPNPEFRFNKTLLRLDDLLAHNFIQTNSAMYRWRFLDGDIQKDFPEEIVPSDYYIHLLHAQTGSIGFIDEVMSVYRRHEGGIWWDSLYNADRLHIKFAISEMRFFDIVYKHIATNQNFYKTNTLLPSYSYFIYNYLQHNKHDALMHFISEFPEYLTESVGYLYSKCLKYKEYINTLKNSVFYRITRKLMANRSINIFYRCLKKVWKRVKKAFPKGGT
jgi:glycosyltransferase involved in cell wall biosynthesis